MKTKTNMLIATAMLVVMGALMTSCKPGKTPGVPKKESVPDFKTTYYLEINTGSEIKVYEGTAKEDDGFVYNTNSEGVKSFSVKAYEEENGVVKINFRAGVQLNPDNTIKAYTDGGSMIIALEDKTINLMSMDPVEGSHSASDLTFFPFKAPSGMGEMGINYMFKDVSLHYVDQLDPTNQAIWIVNGWVKCVPVN